MHARGKTLFGKTLRLNQSILLDQPDQQYISHLVQDQPNVHQHFNATNQISSAISSAQRIQSTQF